MSTTRFTLRCAVYLMLFKDGQILLARRFNTGYRDGMYSIPAGHLDGNETVEDAMIREAKEEVGIEVSKKNLLPATVLHRLSDVEYIDFFFAVTKWHGEPKITEKDKCDDIRWAPISSLPENTLPYIKDAINNYKNKIPFSINSW